MMRKKTKKALQELAARLDSVYPYLRLFHVYAVDNSVYMCTALGKFEAELSPLYLDDRGKICASTEETLFVALRQDYTEIPDALLIDCLNAQKRGL